MFGSLRALRAMHIAVDAGLVSLGWLGAYGVRYLLNEPLGRPINGFEWYLGALPIVVGPWIAAGWAFGIYHGPRMKTGVEELQKVVRGAALGLLMLGCIAFFFREAHFGRAVVALSAVFNLGLQGISRMVFLGLEQRARRSGQLDVKVLILGTGVPAIRLLQKLQDHPETGYEVVGLLDDSEELPEKDVAGHPVLGHLGQLRDVALAHGVEEVFVALPSIGHTRMLSLVLTCEDLNLTFRVVTNLFEVLTTGTQIDLVDDLPLVRLGRERVHAFYAPAKRAFDFVSAAIGLVVFAPLLAWVALRLQRSGQSPFFVHDRVGQHGEIFRMVKFRTLADTAEPQAIAPRSPDDARITAYGKWLRKTSIDELPQLWNVLKGEMSLVGPRPEMPFIVEEYDEWQRRRLAVKPGITGLWQILGRKDLPMHENLQYDFYYIRNRSLSFDLSILFRTVGAVLSRKGAY